MPIHYGGKPPSADVASDVEDIKTAVEDIQSAVGSKETTLSLNLVHGDSGVDVLTADPTTFKEAGTSISDTTANEIFKLTIDTPESGSRTVQALSFFLAWQTKVIAPGSASGESYWQIGSGSTPSSWRTVTDVVTASEDLTDHERSGSLLPTEAATLPFTIRLVGRVLVATHSLRTDILSTSYLSLTYKTA